MAGTLVFKMDDDLKAIIKHAAEHDPGEYYGTKIERSLFLVKDRGVYLMSAGQPGLYPETPRPGRTVTSQLVCYAKGHDPDKGDTWEADRRVMGGDDCAEPLAVSEFVEMAEKGAKEIRIIVKDTSLTLAYVI